MAEGEASEDKRSIAVWTLPLGQHPVVRINISERYVTGEKVFQLACDSLGIQVRSRRFFGLFKGGAAPHKKYATQEKIFVPCRATITIQRWGFDLAAECSVVRTDAVAFRIIAMQLMHQIESGTTKVGSDEMMALAKNYDPLFPCFKQFVEEARKLPWYNALTFKDVDIVSDVMLVNSTIPGDSKIDIVINPKKMMMMSDTVELAVPWTKIRQFVEVKEKDLITLEVFMAATKTFTWIELKSIQRVLLLQAITECIDLVREKLEKTDSRICSGFYKQKDTQSKGTRLSWDLIKKELFGIGKKEETYESFDNVELFTSSDEEEEEEDDDEEEEEEEDNKTMTLLTV